MAFSEHEQPTKRRGRARNVSQAEIKAAWDRIRDKAKAGDVQASALLIALAKQAQPSDHSE